MGKIISQLQPGYNGKEPLERWKEKGTDKVYLFLDSIKRNSVSSMRTYKHGLRCFTQFIKADYPKYNIETILQPLTKGKLDIYELLNQFVFYLQKQNPNLTPSSVKAYSVAVRSYFQFNDLDIIPAKFKRKVKMPKIFREDEAPLDAADIRNIIIGCNNRRLKAYVLCLASTSVRAVEALAIRNKDIDWTTEPPKVSIRSEYSKTRHARTVYLSKESTFHLKSWLDWKYGERVKANPNVVSGTTRLPDHLVFAIQSRSKQPTALYDKMLKQWEKLLDTVNLNGRKDGLSVQHRRQYSFHSLRRFGFSVISESCGAEFAHYILGHGSKSSYYSKKEPERRALWAEKCEPRLTFLDYSALKTGQKNIESKVATLTQENAEKDKEIQMLKQRDSMNTDSIAGLSEKVMQLIEDMEQLKKKEK